MGLAGMLKESCYGNDKVSSKRVIMYTFVTVSIFMIAVEALFSLIIIYKWARFGTEGCSFDTVFDLVIYGYVFGLIAALAGINGFSPKEKQEAKNELTTED